MGENDYRKKRGPPQLKKKPKADPITLQELYDLLLQLEEKDRALSFLLYLTAGRITEIVKDKKTGKGGITQENFYEYEKDGELRYGIRMPNLKSPKTFTKDIPIIVKNDIERAMWLYVANYLANRPVGLVWTDSRNAICNRFRKLKFTAKLTSERDRTYTVGEKKLHPHYLRHCRFSHLAEPKDVGRDKMTPYELAAFGGHSDIRSSMEYVKMNLDRFR